MANIRLNNQNYNGVDEVTLPTVEGGTATFSLDSGIIAPDYVSFNGYEGQSLDISWLDTSDITSMNSMFGGCYELTTIDVSNFDTSNVTNMTYMFSGCSALTNLDLSNFNTSNVTDMSEMFSNCTSLQELNLTSFDFTNVTEYSGMFSNIYFDCMIYVTQSAYDFIEADYNSDNLMGIANMGMFIVTNN